MLTKTLSLYIVFPSMYISSSDLVNQEIRTNDKAKEIRSMVDLFSLSVKPIPPVVDCASRYSSKAPEAYHTIIIRLPQ